MLTAVLGWSGMGGTLAAYLLVSRGHLASSSMRYALLNVAGGLLGGAASMLYCAWPSAASNFMWAAIGAHSVIRARSADYRGSILESTASSPDRIAS